MYVENNGEGLNLSIQVLDGIMCHNGEMLSNEYIPTPKTKDEFLKKYETAYKDFFYAYGFEILKDLDEDYKFELKGSYGNDENYLKETQKIYDNLKEVIENYKKGIALMD